jgi:fructokinase
MTASAVAQISSSPRVVVLGEALVDLHPEDDGRFCPRVGGGPLNTAVGLARLGISTGLVSGVPSGAFGETIRGHLAESGVDLAYLQTSPLPSTLALVESPVDPQFAIYTACTAAFDVGLIAPLNTDVTTIHAASLALFIQPSADAVLDLLEREAGHRLICIDPNIRPSSGPRADVRRRFERLCGLADIVRLSSADHDWLYPCASREESVQHLLTLGPSLVAITFGSEGALAATRSAQAYQHITVTGEVADTVGAGDAFNAALLAHFLLRSEFDRGDLKALTRADLSAMLSWACEAAAINCTRAGADPAWYSELRVSRP